MRRVVVIAAAAMVITGCGDAFRTKVDVAAEVGPYQLGAERLAELLATAKDLPIQREVVEGVAQLWVDYTVFADRLLAGDSLLDSAYVDAAMWAEIQQELADQYHARLTAQAELIDSATVDSAYAAGTYRYIKQILFRVDTGTSAEVREAKRRLAEDTHEALTSGAMTWSQASERNEDPETKDSEGDLGMIGRGEMVAAFENAAYGLAPGEISGVTETSVGYHILWRPPLVEVRDKFRAGLRERRERSFDDEFLAALPERWDLEVRRGIGPAVRELGHDALRAKQSGQVLGTYRGGKFRVSDLARWLQAMPLSVRQQLATASDSQVTMLVSSVMRNAVLIREARDSGVTVAPGFHAEMTDQLRRQLALVSALIGFPIDTLPAVRALPVGDRRKLIQAHVLAYLEAIAQGTKRLQTVPPFLADTLRAEADWKFVAAGVEQVLDRARDLRVALDSLPKKRLPSNMAPAQPPPAEGAPAVPRGNGAR